MDKPQQPAVLPVQTIKAMSPAQQEQYVYDWMNYRVALKQWENTQAEKAIEDNKPPSVGAESVAGLAGPVGVLGGLYALNNFGGGAASAAGGAGGALTGSAAGASSGAAALPAAPNIMNASFSSGASQIPSATNASIAGSSAEGAGSMLGAAAPYLGAAGAGLGAYGLYQGIKEDKPEQAALGGAGLGSGLAAAAPLLGFGPVGALGILGAGLLGGAGGGILGSVFGHKSTKEVQADREKGVAKKVPSYAAFRSQIDQSGFKDGYNPAQDKDFVGIDPTSGRWTNNVFATGGSAGGKKFDVSNLRAEDIWGTPDFFKQYGDKWLGGMSEQERRDIANQALNSGAVTSKKGGIYVDFGKIGQGASTAPTIQVARAPIAAPKPVAPVGVAKATTGTASIPKGGNVIDLAKALSAVAEEEKKPTYNFSWSGRGLQRG